MTTEGVLVRLEELEDVGAIRRVNQEAFGRSDEANLVDSLRTEGAALASFVALDGGLIVGHILFSRVCIETSDGSVPSVALAPLAVLPTHQHRGIGTRLVKFGLTWLRTRGEQSVLVLGDPEYYERFGFSTVAARRLVTPFPSDAFMALELVDKGLAAVRGAVTYPPAFGL